MCGGEEMNVDCISGIFKASKFRLEFEDKSTKKFTNNVGDV
jgi:hypothetical protein